MKSNESTKKKKSPKTGPISLKKKNSFGDKLAYNHIFTSNQKDIFTVLAFADAEEVQLPNKKRKYFNVAASFDIETSSFYQEGEKKACMYIWQLGIDGYCMIGRTWPEFIEVINYIIEQVGINDQRRLIIYIHNASYEFQWIRHLFEWKNVFSVDHRKPLYAITTSGIEFRCSYLQSGYSLADLGANLQKYKVQKMIGYLDYQQIRHSMTPLTDDEILYCINDIKVVMAYIQECIETEGDISKIPLTKTGYVRRYCRKMMFEEEGVPRSKSKKYLHAHSLIYSMQCTGIEEAQMWHRSFSGGFTHTNPMYSNETLENVASEDETSAYPLHLILHQFPMSTGQYHQVKNYADFKKSLKLYCCIFDVTFEGLESRILFDSYLSSSKCWNLIGAKINNGRIVECDRCSTTITEIDFDIISKVYKWKKIKIGKMIRYKKDFLPKDLVLSVLELYRKKTELKGIKGAETDYLVSKGMLNAVYGMCCTSFTKALVTYQDYEWGLDDSKSLDDMINDYNKSKNRFLFYPWGIYICAYNRKALWMALFECKEDYIYADTDSCKYLNYERHKPFFDKYNANLIKSLYKVMDHHGIDRAMISPSNKKGIPQPLGVWDHEGVYSKFKALGAKRYLTEKDGEVLLTVSGLNKKVATPWMLEEFGDNIFDEFTDELHVPAEYTGKLTHTYIDEEIYGMVTDYLGNTGYYHELSSIHMEPAEYSLDMDDQYIEYINYVKTLIRRKER